MLGAIVGDIVGSVYEWDNIKTKDFPLFRKDCFFTDDTVKKVLSQNAEIVAPRCEGRSGHPISVHRELIPAILSYQGEEGLRGALNATGIPIQYVDVEDQGTLMDADTREDFEKLVMLHNEMRSRWTFPLKMEKQWEKELF